MKKKTFYGFIAILLVGALVLASAIGSSWFTNGNVKTWFNSWGQNISAPDKGNNEGNTDNLGEGTFAFTPGVDNSGIRLASVRSATVASTGVETHTITATVTPMSSAVVIDWTIEKGEDFTAENVSNYLTVTASSDTLLATVTCKTAFTGTLYVVATECSSNVFSRCAVRFVGKPSTMSASSSMPQNGGYYEMKAVGTTTINFTLGNVFNQVGDKYNDFEITSVNYGGTCTYGNCVVSSGSTSYSQTADVSFSNYLGLLTDNNVELPISFTLNGNVLQVNCKKALTSCYTKLTSMWGMDNYYNRFKEEVTKCYFEVKVTEKVSGLSQTVKIAYASTFVQSVDLSDTVLEF